MGAPFAEAPSLVGGRTLLLRRRRWGAVVALAPWVLHGSAGAVPSASPPGPDDLPKVVLVNQDNEPVRFYEDLVRGRHVIAINFMYAQCSDICPSTTANLVRVQALLGERLGREVRMASISIDPERDTPKILKAYSRTFGARSGWQFLTGKAKDITRLRRHLGAFERDPRLDRDKTQHTGMVVYGNESRGRWGRVSALADPQRIFESLTRWA